VLTTVTAGYEHNHVSIDNYVLFMNNIEDKCLTIYTVILY